MSLARKSSFGIAKSNRSFTVSVYVEHELKALDGTITWMKVNLGSKTFPKGPVDIVAEWRQ